MQEESIRNWMNAIPDVSQQVPTSTTSRKRRRVQSITPANSDKCSHDNNIPFIETPYMSPPSTRAEGSKRLPPNDDENTPMDNDPTPRAPRSKRLQTARSESSYSLSAQSQESSGRLSPIKLIQVLELDPRGLRFDDLSHFHTLPPSIDALLEEMEVIAEGQGIVSPMMKGELMEASQTHRDFKWVSRRDGYFDSKREGVGHTPSPRKVMDVLAAAAECSTSMHPEVNWNNEVHQRLLSLAYRPRDRDPFGNLVNFTGTYVRPSDPHTNSFQQTTHMIDQTEQQHPSSPNTETRQSSRKSIFVSTLIQQMRMRATPWFLLQSLEYDALFLETSLISRISHL